MEMMLGKWQSGGGRSDLREQAEIGVKTFVVRELERAVGSFYLGRHPWCLEAHWPRVGIGANTQDD